MLAGDICGSAGKTGRARTGDWEVKRLMWLIIRDPLDNCCPG